MTDVFFCARVFHYEIRVPRFLLLFLWFSEAAGGGRDALNLVQNPPEKAASVIGGFFVAVSLVGFRLRP